MNSFKMGFCVVNSTEHATATNDHESSTVKPPHKPNIPQNYRLSRYPKKKSNPPHRYIIQAHN